MDTASLMKVCFSEALLQTCQQEHDFCQSFLMHRFWQLGLKNADEEVAERIKPFQHSQQDGQIRSMPHAASVWWMQDGSDHTALLY
jgi:hypothetical protein